MDTLQFIKRWERPENARHGCPIACYRCTSSSIINILQYADNDFRPPVNHIMYADQKRKSFPTLEAAIAYVNSNDWR